MPQSADQPRKESDFEIGVYTFADRSPEPGSGKLISARQRLEDLMEEISLADEVGLDVFGVGEHHRPDYVVSAPAVVLAAAAQRSKRIKLTSAVTVLSSDDPVRVFQAFATVDLLSGGRAEIMAGRGSFIESFPLFGYDLNHYDELFAEKLELLLELRRTERVTWSGRFRPSLSEAGIYPRPESDQLPVWIAVGGTPKSAIRAGTLGLPMALAIIGGMPERFLPFVEIYREAGKRSGHAEEALGVGINSHAFIARDSKSAADNFYPYYAEVMTRIGRERGWSPTSREQFESLRGPRGALLVGDPQEVIDKILYQHSLFGHQRFLAQMDVGAVPHRELMESIELLGTVVAPAVRKALSERG